MAEHLVLSLEGTTGAVEEVQLVYVSSTTTLLRRGDICEGRFSVLQG
jgi:hypothetical protein